MVTPKVVKRSRGNVVTLLVEIDASQAKHLNEISQQLGKSKTQVVAEALNIWFSMVEGVR